MKNPVLVAKQQDREVANKSPSINQVRKEEHHHIEQQKNYSKITDSKREIVTFITIDLDIRILDLLIELIEKNRF